MTETKDLSPVAAWEYPHCRCIPVENLIDGSNHFDVPVQPEKKHVFDRLVRFERPIRIRRITIPSAWVVLVKLSVLAVLDEASEVELHTVNGSSVSVRDPHFEVSECPPVWSIKIRMTASRTRTGDGSALTFSGDLILVYLHALMLPLEQDLAAALKATDHPGTNGCHGHGAPDTHIHTLGTIALVTKSGDRVPALSAVLAARSPVFKAMFNTSMREAKEGVVHLDDVPTSAVQAFVHLMHTDALPTDLSAEDLCYVCELAALYDVPWVKPMVRPAAQASCRNDFAAFVRAAHRFQNQEFLEMTVLFAMRTGTGKAALLSALTSKLSLGRGTTLALPL